jgi:tRNA(Arg) A34 adenosine deaminase TadA
LVDRTRDVLFETQDTALVDGDALAHSDMNVLRKAGARSEPSPFASARDCETRVDQDYRFPLRGPSGECQCGHRLWQVMR